MSLSAKDIKLKILADEYSHLNKMQQEAVFATGNPLLILSGAGSGKTTVIVNKISYLMRYGSTAEYSGDVSAEDTEFLNECLSDKSLRNGARYMSLMQHNPIAPEKILAITFTNKAAEEMRTRIEYKFGINATGMWALTFHSTCVRLLRMYATRLGYTSDFTIYDDQDSQKLTDTVIRALNLKTDRYPSKLCRKIIGNAKTKYMTPAQFREALTDFGYADLPKLPDIYEEYQKELKLANAFDFDDLIFKTVQLLEDNPDIAERVRNRFDYVLVDEYQDTNPLQYRLVCLLVKDDNICVVGDDDQSIYRFMGADIGNILNFEDRFDNTRVIRLEQNYRSTQTILDAANSVISKNSRRKGKNLWTDKGKGEPIVYSHQSSHYEEASFISKTILTQIAEGKKYNDFCVLYRTHSQSNTIEASLRGNGIPYRVYGGLAFYRRKEVQDALAYLNILINPNDKTRLMRIINEPKRGIGFTTVDKIKEICDNTGESLFEVLSHAADYPALSCAADKLTAFANTINSLTEDARTMKLSELYPKLLHETGYTAMINALEVNEASSRLENLQELLNNIVHFEEQAGQEATLRNFLEEQALVSAVDDLNQDESAVTLMTMHCAKGLEFDTVFISGFEEGIFPSSQSVGEQGGIEEERRLCYVAITRAKKQLYIVNAQSRMMYGRVNTCFPSRFLKEIPDELITGIEVPKREHKTTAEQRAERMERHREAFAKNTSTATVIPHTEKQAKYVAGMRVLHRTFGEGTVKAVLSMTADTMLTISFDSVGEKKLMANYAKLEIL